jgi:hypothetical protein
MHALLHEDEGAAPDYGQDTEKPPINQFVSHNVNLAKVALFTKAKG